MVCIGLWSCLVAYFCKLVCIVVSIGVYSAVYCLVVVWIGM